MRFILNLRGVGVTERGAEDTLWILGVLSKLLILVLVPAAILGLAIGVDPEVIAGAGMFVLAYLVHSALLAGAGFAVGAFSPLPATAVCSPDYGKKLRSPDLRSSWSFSRFCLPRLQYRRSSAP